MLLLLLRFLALVELAALVEYDDGIGIYMGFHIKLVVVVR